MYSVRGFKRKIIKKKRKREIKKKKLNYEKFVSHIIIINPLKPFISTHDMGN